MPGVNMKKFLLLITFLSVSTYVQAECSKDDAMQAEAKAAQLKDWNDVYESYKRYSHCDDGAIAEGSSESVSQLLGKKWDQLSNLEKIIKKDKKFKDFVIKHVDQTIADDVRVEILNNTSKHCPSKSTALCRKISSAAKKNK